jgi:hypothetical protein
MNIFKRLCEPSTWAGLATILQAAKVIVPPQYHLVLDGATAVAGAIAVRLPEEKPPLLIVRGPAASAAS